jgi:hypothetical protein
MLHDPYSFTEPHTCPMWLATGPLRNDAEASAIRKWGKKLHFEILSSATSCNYSLPLRLILIARQRVNPTQRRGAPHRTHRRERSYARPCITCIHRPRDVETDL